MQVVEFLNQFHISTGFGRFANSEKMCVKGICVIKEWSTDIFTGRYIDNVENVGAIHNIKLETINIPFEYSRTNQKVVWRKYAPIARWHNEKKVWIVPIAYKDQVYGIGNMCRATHIVIKDNLPERVDTIPELPKLDFVIPLKKGAMRNYQEEGVARGLQLKRFINGDQPGLGKTLQSIATLEGAIIKGDRVTPTLVICPASLKINWQREFEMWTHRKPMILTAKNADNWHRFYELGMNDVFICNYESLKRHFVLSMPKAKDLKHSSDIVMDPRISIFKSIIIDESHKLRSEKSMAAKICINITNRKEYVICLTGTPVVNKPIDLYSQLAVIFKLAHFGGPEGFKKRYCEGGRGQANLKELNYLLNMSCYFVRKKEDVLKDLPELSRQTLLCSITNRVEFDKVRDDFKSFLKTANFSDADIKRKVNAETIVKINMLLQISAKGKVEAAQEYIDEIIESGQKIVVFCKHTVVVELLKAEYPKAVCVTGQQDGAQKQAAVDGFQNNPDVNIILVNYKAGGVGITLTKSSEILMFELPWTQADCEQAEARCHRMGQANSVRATYLLGENTLDQWMYDIIQEKKGIANTITGVDDNIPVSIIDKVINLFK